MASRLNPGEMLNRGERLTSPSNRFFLQMQYDGNLVLYLAPKLPLWASCTDNTSANRAVMQNDGNFVIYGDSNRVHWALSWLSPSVVLSIGSFIQVQDDANLVIYRSDISPVWATHTRDPVQTVFITLMSLSDEDFRNACEQCGAQVVVAAAVGAGNNPLDPKTGAAMGAAGAIAASPDCRKALSEVMSRATQRAREALDTHREREARDHWERIDKDNHDLEQYERFEHTA